MKKITTLQWGWIVSLSILGSSIYMHSDAKEKENFTQSNAEYNVPENSTGWDYKNSRWIVKENGTFNEAELEEIRRNLPDDEYLYTPSRARGYRSTEEKIEDYIDDNIDEIIEDYEKNL